jgi:hypothetical protein
MRDGIAPRRLSSQEHDELAEEKRSAWDRVALVDGGGDVERLEPEHEIRRGERAGAQRSRLMGCEIDSETPPGRDCMRERRDVSELESPD